MPAEQTTMPALTPVMADAHRQLAQLVRLSLQRLGIGAAEVSRQQRDAGRSCRLRDGAVVPLKPRAFGLLAFLVANPGQVFSRDQLLERVWGTDYPGETRTVDVHVHALREAIEADPGDPRLIETVRGVGYVFRGPEAPVRG